MPSFEETLRFMESRTVLALLLAVVVVIGIMNAWPHVAEPIWQDEAATLSFHSQRGILGPFLAYHSPNNHVAFSSMLAAWIKIFPQGIDVVTLRLLPTILSVGAIPVMFFAARAIGGTACAALATTLFASSTIFGNFATQLRGYGPSWLFISLLLLCALHFFDSSKKWFWRAGYIAATFVSVAILPTNFFFAFVVSVCVAIYLSLNHKNRGPHALAGFVILLAASPVCLVLAYSAIWSELVSYSAVGFSAWTRAALLENWLHASLSDFRWLAPLVGAGLLVGAGRRLTGRWQADETGSREFVLVCALAAGFVASIYAMPKVPFPRTLTPFLPVWFCALSFLTLYGLRSLKLRTNRVWFASGLLIFALPIVAAAPAKACKADTGSGGATDYDLCYQYFRDAYHPVQVVDVWAQFRRDDLPIVTSFEGYHAIRILGSKAKVFEYRHYPESGTIPMLVAHDRAELDQMTETLGLANEGYELIADTGYFKVYVPQR